MTMIPTEHEKSEWSRLAQDAYSKDRNDIGHRFSIAASAKAGVEFELTYFDELQGEYRQWLNFGFSTVEPEPVRTWYAGQGLMRRF